MSGVGKEQLLDFVTDLGMPHYVAGVILLAREAGCCGPEHGLRWAIEQGYIEGQLDLDDPAALAVTAEGVAAVDARFPKRGG